MVTDQHMQDKKSWSFKLSTMRKEGNVWTCNLSWLVSSEEIRNLRSSSAIAISGSMDYAEATLKTRSDNSRDTIHHPMPDLIWTMRYWMRQDRPGMLLCQWAKGTTTRSTRALSFRWKTVRSYSMTRSSINSEGAQWKLRERSSPINMLIWADYWTESIEIIHQLTEVDSLHYTTKLQTLEMVVSLIIDRPNRIITMSALSFEYNLYYL
jgi:hypothetical protein